MKYIKEYEGIRQIEDDSELEKIRHFQGNTVDFYKFFKKKQKETNPDLEEEDDGTMPYQTFGNLRNISDKEKENLEFKNEEVEVPVEIGDVILRGRFKNIRTVVKEIGHDANGQLIINGKKFLTFRILTKKQQQEEQDKLKKKEEEK